MIALNETNEIAAEIPFFLADVNNPLQGLLGHSFVLGEAQIKLPGSGTWDNVALNKIFELDHGWYVIRLTSGQCTTEGTVKWRVVDSTMTITFQPTRGTETIGTLGGDIPQNGTGYLVFYLPDEVDPIYADPITGFPGGAVRIRLPGGSFADGDTGLVVEFGEGLYGYPLDTDDTVNAGKAFVYATATGAQDASTYSTILGVGISEPEVILPTPIPVITTADLATVAVYKDLIAGAVNRLCEYSKSGNFVADTFTDNVG